MSNTMHSLELDAILNVINNKEQPGLVERQFLGYMRLLYRTPVEEMPPAQVNQLRQAFYGGATLYQGIMLGNLAPGVQVTQMDERLAGIIFDQYAKELEEFADRCATGMAPAQGSA
jgi:hypothetical protein